MNVTVLKKELHQIHIASHYKVVYCISFSCPASAAQTENLIVFMS